MAMLEGVFVNLGSCGSGESPEGIGDISLSGVRNFLQHDWPQMDIGQINFYNPRVCKDEVARNRRLTRNQAHWLTRQITGFINTLDIPNEDRFDPRSENGNLLPSEEPDLKDAPLGSVLEDALNKREQQRNGMAPDVYCTMHSLEACLTEAVRDNPGWAKAVDHQALVNARALLHPTT